MGYRKGLLILWGLVIAGYAAVLIFTSPLITIPQPRQQALFEQAAGRSCLRYERILAEELAATPYQASCVAARNQIAADARLEKLTHRALIAIVRRGCEEDWDIPPGGRCLEGGVSPLCVYTADPTCPEQPGGLSGN